jgi:type II secretory pathway pseudopilin PulG
MNEILATVVPPRTDGMDWVLVALSVILLLGSALVTWAARQVRSVGERLAVLLTAQQQGAVDDRNRTTGS